MSRRDARKAVVLGLPEALRKELVRQSEAHVPLAYLVRQTLRRAMDAGLDWAETVSQGDRRPILVQLSCEERARLEMWVTAKQVTEEEAILSLIDGYLKQEARKPPKPDAPTRRGRR
ncbi:hypothetical protein [Maliponia aquimaris]|uniref:Uncharacterized protein n=1 Tax=Maliponia aquimaris TaxID=1673631 RepID=A0A238KAC6_9RHOB|nr:hypothetical protein [Maliponia aquimaris]SMX38926.1 hypothetical protein MAA8898_01790 [Maliponia aquimaris]